MIVNVLYIFFLVQSTTDPKGSNVKVTRPRRPRGNQPRQQLTTEETFLKIQEMQERLNFEIRQQVALSERIDTVVRLYINGERELQKVQRQVRGLTDMSNKIDMSLDYVVRGITQAQGHIQEQCLRQPNEDDDDDDMNNHQSSS